MTHTYLTVNEDRKYYIDHLDEYIEFIDNLEDELSRQTVIARIKTYFTLDRQWLMRVAQGHNQFTSASFSSNALVISNEEIYVDVGAAHGDTVATFFNFCRGQYCEIHAFEPDSVNYDGLKRLCDVIPRSYCYHKGLSDEMTTLSFNEQETNRFGSRFDNTNNALCVNIQTLRLDDVLAKATLIKIDTEGFENKVINGMQRIIQECNPSMHIAGYHYPQDLISIINNVNKIHKYKNIAIRHADGSLYDTNILFSDRQKFF
jgi:FkbM family methyltransferase